MALASISTRSFEVILVKMRRADESCFYHLCQKISQRPFAGIHNENVSHTHTHMRRHAALPSVHFKVTQWQRNDKWVDFCLKFARMKLDESKGGLGEEDAEDAEASSCWGCSAGRWVCAESSPDALWGWSWKALRAGSAGRWEEQPGATSSKQDRWPSPGGAEQRWGASAADMKSNHLCRFRRLRLSTEDNWQQLSGLLKSFSILTDNERHETTDQTWCSVTLSSSEGQCDCFRDWMPRFMLATNQMTQSHYFSLTLHFLIQN